MPEPGRVHGAISFHGTQWKGDTEDMRRYFAAITPEPTWGFRGNAVWVMTAYGPVEVPFGHWILTDGSGKFLDIALTNSEAPPSITDDL